MVETILFGSVALVHGAFFLWLARGGAKGGKTRGAQIMKGKGPMTFNTKVWDQNYWDNIQKTKNTFGR